MLVIEHSHSSPSSFPVTASNRTLSPNLYVSHAATTGILFSLANMATAAVPAREYRLPSENKAAVPRRTSEARGIMLASEERRV